MQIPRREEGVTQCPMREVEGTPSPTQGEGEMRYLMLEAASERPMQMREAERGTLKLMQALGGIEIEQEVAGFKLSGV